MASAATGQLGQRQKLCVGKNTRSVIVRYKMGVNGPAFQARKTKYRTVAQSLNRWRAMQLHPAGHAKAASLRKKTARFSRAISAMLDAPATGPQRSESALQRVPVHQSTS